jgi:hypothetical protein
LMNIRSMWRRGYTRHHMPTVARVGVTVGAIEGTSATVGKSGRLGQSENALFLEMERQFPRETAQRLPS